MDMGTQGRPTQHGRIMLGVLITAAGLLMVIDRLGLRDVRLTSQIWPLFPLGLGLLRVIDPPALPDGRARSRQPGAWLVFIGCWGLVNEFHVLGLDYHNSWPLVVVFAGIQIVWRAIEGQTSAVSPQVPPAHPTATQAERRQP